VSTAALGQELQDIAALLPTGRDHRQDVGHEPAPLSPCEPWTDRWQKAPTKKNREKRSPRAYICGGHSSVKKIMNKEHREIPLTPASESKPPPFETAKKDV
jgi:hypothetical protein